MRPADHDLGTAGGVLHLDHIDLDAVALLQVLTADALVQGQHGLGKLAVGGDADRDRTVARFDMGDDAGEDLVLLGGELFINQAAFGLADALNDDLLGGLRRDAAELLGLDRDGDGFAQLGPAGNLLRAVKIDLVIGVGDLFDDELVDLHLDAFFIFIQDDLDVVLVLGVVAAERGEHRLADLIVHIVAGNAFFLFNVFDGCEKFCIHVWLTPFLILSLRNYPPILTARRTCAIWFFSKRRVDLSGRRMLTAPLS